MTLLHPRVFRLPGNGCDRGGSSSDMPLFCCSTKKSKKTLKSNFCHPSVLISPASLRKTSTAATPASTRFVLNKTTRNFLLLTWDKWRLEGLSLPPQLMQQKNSSFLHSTSLPVLTFSTGRFSNIKYSVSIWAFFHILFFFSPDKKKWLQNISIKPSKLWFRLLQPFIINSCSTFNLREEY